MDLGGTPSQALRRVLLPLLSPAILASVALVFADSVDDFVTVRYLSGPADSEPLSVKIYSAARSSPTPAVNAAATVMLVATLLVIALGLARVPAAQPGSGGGDVGELRRAVATGSEPADRSARLGVLEVARERDRRPRVGQHAQRFARHVHGHRRRPTRRAARPPSFWIHAWMRLTGREVTNTCRIEPT